MKRTAFSIGAIVAVGSVLATAEQQSQSPYDLNSQQTNMVEQTVAGTKFKTLPGFTIERLNPPGKTDTYVILTFDAEARPVVAREYDVPLRLIDKDGDGMYESEQVITEKLNTCQGLWFDGPTMYGHCHETQTPDEVSALQAKVTAALQNQTPVGGSTVRSGGGGGGGRGGAAAAGAAGAAGGRGAVTPAAPARPGETRVNGPAAFFKATDTNGDGTADVVERVAQLVGTVGDHGPHAIRRGPDGSIMLMQGNAGGTPLNEYINPDSRIIRDKEAQFNRLGNAGGGSQRDGVHSALYRYDPATNKYTVITGGNRNTYDFAFNLIGEAFWYDSDHEPEIGVPWYRQVRSVHGIPGGNYGYRNGTNKYPQWYIDSLPPLRDLDRGSPVGVETYESYAYPSQFFDMVLEADWSRGRLLYNQLKPAGGTYTGLPGGLSAPAFVFGEPLNMTDLEVGPDGMIYFTTGGRATVGGFWRIKYTGAAPAQPDMTGIWAVVRQPQPLSAWGWARIERVKATMGAAAFGAALEQVARTTSNNGLERARALYEMNRHGAPPSDALLTALIADRDDNVRLAAIYVAGRRNAAANQATAPTAGRAQVIRTAMKDSNAMVRRRAAEAVIELGQRPDRPAIVPAADIYSLMADTDRFVRFSARLALEFTPRADWADRVISDTNTNSVMEGMLAWVRTANGANLDPVLNKQLGLMKNTNLSVDDKLRLLRTFEYTTTEMPNGLDAARREQLFGLWASQFPATDERLNREVALVLAYSQQPGAIGEILAAIPSGNTNQPLQIHYLYALRTVKTGWTRAQKEQVADIFARTANWRGGMGSALGQIWGEFMDFFSEEDKQMAYAKAPAYAPPPAPPAGAPVAAAGGRGGGGGFGGGGGVLTSKEERFDSLLFRADQRGGDFGGRTAAASAESGRAVFEKNCSSCHKAGAVGSAAGGPDLTGGTVGRRAYLEGIFWPERKVDAQWQSTTITTKDNRTVRGLITGETAAAVTLKMTDGTSQEVQKTNIASQRKENHTIMPELFDRIAQNELNEMWNFIVSTK